MQNAGCWKPGSEDSRDLGPWHRLLTDSSGRMVMAPAFLHANYFSEGLASVNTGRGKAHRSVAEACEVGFIDTAGSFVITPGFLATGRFQDGLCLVETENQIGYINRSGDFIWQSNWVEVGDLDPLHLLPPENRLNS